ncbi:MAG: hypothetical protein LWX00_07635, partial [Spirochaetia bacterium]|nr:hypothetical protein [Spirochaetia bacterium]
CQQADGLGGIQGGFSLLVFQNTDAFKRPALHGACFTAALKKLEKTQSQFPKSKSLEIGSISFPKLNR